MTHKKYLDAEETIDGSEFIDKDEFIKDVMERFHLTDKQATVVYHMGLGDNVVEAVNKCYSTKAGGASGGSKQGTSNAFHQTTKLMNMHKFQQALDYIGNEEFIELRLKRMKLYLLEWGKNKLRDTNWHPTASAGVWKSMMALAFDDKLPDDGKNTLKALDKLTEHFKQMDATRKAPKPLPELVEDEDEGDTKH